MPWNWSLSTSIIILLCSLLLLVLAKPLSGLLIRLGFALAIKRVEMVPADILPAELPESIRSRPDVTAATAGFAELGFTHGCTLTRSAAASKLCPVYSDLWISNDRRTYGSITTALRGKPLVTVLVGSMREDGVAIQTANRGGASDTSGLVQTKLLHLAPVKFLYDAHLPRIEQDAIRALGEDLVAHFRAVNEARARRDVELGNMTVDATGTRYRRTWKGVWRIAGPQFSQGLRETKTQLRHRQQAQPVAQVVPGAATADGQSGAILPYQTPDPYAGIDRHINRIAGGMLLTAACEIGTLILTCISTVQELCTSDPTIPPDELALSRAIVIAQAALLIPFGLACIVLQLWAWRLLKNTQSKPRKTRFITAAAGILGILSLQLGCLWYYTAAMGIYTLVIIFNDRTGRYLVHRQTPA